MFEKQQASKQVLIKPEFPRQCSKNIQIRNFKKIRQVGAELFRKDGKT